MQSLRPAVLRLFPMLRWWPMVDRSTLRGDALAGLTGTIILVPQAVAYASIAGLPPEYGLYTAIVPVVIAAFFGSSWHLVSGPTAAISIVIYSTISTLATPGSPEYIGLVLTLTFMVGALTLAMALARLGMLVNFVSHSVVVGFTAGAAILIATSQLKNFFGVPSQAGASFVETLTQFVQHIDRLDPFVTAVGMVTLLSSIAVKRWFPRVPNMISAMLAGSAFGLLLEWIVAGPTGVATVSAVPRSLPPLSSPVFDLELMTRLAPVALALTMLALTEAIAIARAVALKSGQRIDANQEFVGQGLANLVGSFFSAYVSSGSFTRSGVNYTAGARTPLAATFSAIFLLAVLLLLAPLVRFLPIASMAAILFIVAWSLIDVHHMRVIVRTSRREAAVLATTLLATLFLELEFAIYVGVTLSLLLFLERTARPSIRSAVPAPGPNSRHFIAQTGEPDCCQLKMLLIDGPLYFGAVDHVLQRLREVDAVEPRHRHLLILARGIGFVDVSGAEMLAQEARRRRQMHGGLYFYRMQASVKETLRRAGHLDDIGVENLFDAGQDVLAEIHSRLDPQACRSCRYRNFEACASPLRDGQPGASPASLATRPAFEAKP